MKHRTSPAVALLLTLGAAAAEAKPAAPMRHDFYEFLFHGQKVGYLEAHDEKVSFEGKPAVRSLRRSVITVRRQSNVIRMEATTEAHSELDGRPIAFTHIRTEGGVERRIEGKRAGDALKVTVSVGGAPTEHRYPLGPNVFLSAGLDVVLKAKLDEKRALKGSVVVEEDGSLGQYESKVIRTERDGDRTVYVFESRLVTSGTELVSTEWIRDDGTTLKTAIPRIGAETVLATEAKAMELGVLQDIFTRAKLTTGVHLPRSEDLEEVTFRLTTPGGTSPVRPVADARQSVAAAGAALVVEVKTIDPGEHPPRLPLKVTDKKLKTYLAATPYESLTDPALVGAAKEALGDAKDAWTAARRLNAFVYRHIKDKTLAKAFSTASEALGSREGDCTEHAVLLSALAKITGIPAKLVTGLVYVGGEGGEFGYHEWAELWIGDRWVAMDPTFGQDVADPTHLKFTEGLSDADGLRQAGVVAAELFGRLKLEIAEYRTLDGQRGVP